MTQAISNIEDYSHSTRLLAATTLRNVLGTRNLAEILSERESISRVMQDALDEATDPWGVKAERVEMWEQKNIYFIFYGALMWHLYQQRRETSSAITEGHGGRGGGSSRGQSQGEAGYNTDSDPVTRSAMSDVSARSQFIWGQ